MREIMKGTLDQKLCMTMTEHCTSKEFSNAR